MSEDQINPTDTGPITGCVNSIITQFGLISGDPNRVKQDCKCLQTLLSGRFIPEIISFLKPLSPLLQKRSGPIAEYLFDFLEGIVRLSNDPQPLLIDLLQARDQKLVERSLDLVPELAQNNTLLSITSLLEYFGDQVRSDNQIIRNPEFYKKIEGIIRLFLGIDISEFKDLFIKEKDISIRSLYAFLLDQNNIPINEQIAASLFGYKNGQYLFPLLTYTHATFSDLLYFHSDKTQISKLISQLKTAEKNIGRNLLLQIIASMGWVSLNKGLEWQKLSNVSFLKSAPLVMTQSDVSLLNNIKIPKEIDSLILVIAEGGRLEEPQGEESVNDPVTRFRAYNLVHAELLTYFLDVNPLTLKKVEFILEKMNRIVEDFALLFSQYTNECSILASIFSDLREKIQGELDRQTTGPQLSANLTRLVQAFEDPQNPGQIQTLHGLKRYLHQKGLSLGFRLVETGHSPNRIVELVMFKNNELHTILKKIHYADFESDTTSTARPYAVQLLIDGYKMQFIHGQRHFPSANIFCYGNEVHYYFSFRNHPAFLRIDFSPPLRGGMIDLEYFGVSNYEANVHPNISLDAIRILFERLEFDSQISGTRIHARYDKERSLDLGDLCQKAKLVLAFVPYLMDLDWMIGSLSLSDASRKVLAKAWAEFFCTWGWLPLHYVLTSDRRGILVNQHRTPTGLEEIRWDGDGAYRDIFLLDGLSQLGYALSDKLRQFGLAGDSEDCHWKEFGVTQLTFDCRFLHQVHKAIEYGELIEVKNKADLQPSKEVIRIHPIEQCAELLSIPETILQQAVQTGYLVRVLERFLTFRTIGTLNGFEIQSAHLSLTGDLLYIYVLRGENNIIQMAFFTPDAFIYKTSNKKPDQSNTTSKCDPVRLNYLLRINNYIDANFEIRESVDAQEVQKLLYALHKSMKEDDHAPLTGEKIVAGLKASPGKCAGRILMRHEGMDPREFKDTIFVEANINPGDTTSMYHAEGIVSTGGGVLSHAGLIAMQFHKPAVILEGRWQHNKQNERELVVNTISYSVEAKQQQKWRLSIRRNIQTTEVSMREGDLVLLDATDGKLTHFGQDRALISLFEGFRLYNTVNNLLVKATMPEEILMLRGKRSRARQQIENILSRTADAGLARYAIYEILEAGNSPMSDKINLLGLLLNHTELGSASSQSALDILHKLQSECKDTYSRALERTPKSIYMNEILSLRLTVRKQYDVYKNIYDLLHQSGIPVPQLCKINADKIEILTRNRLQVIREGQLNTILSYYKKDKTHPYLRHMSRQISRINALLKPTNEDELKLTEIETEVRENDSDKIHQYEKRYLISHQNCGFELASLTGWKAANLGETGQLCGTGHIPQWFVVTDYAFNKVLNSPVRIPVKESDDRKSGKNLIQQIDEILSLENLSNRQKAGRIQALWENAEIPSGILNPILKEYRKIKISGHVANALKDTDDKVYVALRSSSCEEDTETAARAGEFETYLYIGDEENLIRYLKRTWSSLWTERAIHNRRLFSTSSTQTGGGIIVQRMVNSRVSGVLQTVNIARGNLNEMIVNAGLGLGEGIVSGAVSADQVIISKDCDLENGPLKFNYITSDKTEQVVFNQHAGFGTVKTNTLYHQRLRPALEYVELFELVQLASRLEKIYGYPLDIEFGIESDHLWILQVRPVAAFLSVYNETVNKVPISIA